MKQFNFEKVRAIGDDEYIKYVYEFTQWQNKAKLFILNALKGAK